MFQVYAIRRNKTRIYWKKKKTAFAESTGRFFGLLLPSKYSWQTLGFGEPALMSTNGKDVQIVPGGCLF